MSANEKKKEMEKKPLKLENIDKKQEMTLIDLDFCFNKKWEVPKKPSGQVAPKESNTRRLAVEISGSVDVGAGFFFKSSLSIHFQWTWRAPGHEEREKECKKVMTSYWGNWFGSWAGAWLCPVAVLVHDVLNPKIYIKVCHFVNMSY